jgi:ATP-dependent DNA helicase PIF1
VIPLELNTDFAYALDAMERDGKNMFITGRAGTGKSTLLQLFRHTTRKKCVVLAPTGVAALNIKGQTIHSFFGFPPRYFQQHDIKRRRDRRLYQLLEILIIDEISMVRADIIDHIDYFLRLHRDMPHLPFGGVQVVFFGDLFQLPPVVGNEVEAVHFRQRYATPYFFSADVIKAGFELDMLELRKVYRQEQRHFLQLLDAVRLNEADYEVMESLNERHLPDFDPEEAYVTLCSRNARADAINQQALQGISAPEKRYLAKISGEFNPGIQPADPVLRLKEGAQVMFLKNDPERKFVNGSIGRVISLDDDRVKVRIDDEDIEVKEVDWEMLRYRPDPDQAGNIIAEVTGTFSQLPLRLAWALTIHKAQGKTFDRIIIDMAGGAFEHGQTYVALSRCRTLEGIILRHPLRPKDMIMDPSVVEYFQDMQRG